MLIEAMGQQPEQSKQSPVHPIMRSCPIGMPSVREMIMEVFRVGHAITIGAIVFICLAICGAVAFVVFSAPPTTITITSGPEGSVFQRNAAKYASLLAAHGVTLENPSLPRFGGESAAAQ